MHRYTKNISVHRYIVSECLYILYWQKYNKEDIKMKMLLGFHNGMCGLLRMVLSSDYTIFEYPENLALGNIECCKIMSSRIEAQKILYYHDPGSMKEQLNRCNSFFEFLTKHQTEVTEITVWMEVSAPYICNLLFLLSCPEIANIPVYCVCIDKNEKNGIHRMIHKKQSNRILLSGEDRLCAVHRWKALVKDNRSLRIYLNDSLVNAEYFYYDELLLHTIRIAGTDFNSILLHLIDLDIIYYGVGFILWRYSLLKRQQLF